MRRHLVSESGRRRLYGQHRAFGLLHKATGLGQMNNFLETRPDAWLLLCLLPLNLIPLFAGSGVLVSYHMVAHAEHRPEFYTTVSSSRSVFA